ncbi:MAG: sugar ABC transporter substrate-binding protein [Treponema sp.]|jgi:multiple sugar transport system substrate-binding protein|nr:sugar ABC transporter substrate-binding protein [Treponema sp.]
MNLRKGRILAVVCLVLLVLADCKGKKAAAGGDAADATGAFDWKRYAGSEITVYMVEHMTSQAMVSQIKDFTEATGIKVNQQITPEANYFDQVSNALSSRSGTPDLFMSGAYQIWDYSTAGNVEPLDAYLNNPSLTNSDYDYGDFVQSTVNSMKWDGVAGHAVGNGPLWAIPLGCEVYLLAYNKTAFQKAGITKVPETYAELLDACDKLKEWNGSGSYAIALRGARDWGTIHPGYMSVYKNFGATDFATEGGKLVSKVNSPASVAMNEFWVDLVRRGGSPQWSSTVWYMAMAEFGAGKAAMYFDASNGEIQVDFQSMKEKGNIAFTVMPVAKAGDKINSNFWIWSMAMNSNSKNKGAAWLYLQYFSSKEFLRYASVEMNNMDPVRTSVWNNPGFLKKLEAEEGYKESWEKTAATATIQFTPQPAFFQTTYDWAETLQDLVAGSRYPSVQAGLDALKQRMDTAVAE